MFCCSIFTAERVYDISIRYLCFKFNRMSISWIFWWVGCGGCDEFWTTKGNGFLYLGTQELNTKVCDSGASYWYLWRDNAPWGGEFGKKIDIKLGEKKVDKKIIVFFFVCACDAKWLVVMAVRYFNQRYAQVEKVKWSYCGPIFQENPPLSSTTISLTTLKHHQFHGYTTQLHIVHCVLYWETKRAPNVQNCTKIAFNQCSPPQIYHTSFDPVHLISNAILLSLQGTPRKVKMTFSSSNPILFSPFPVLPFSSIPLPFLYSSTTITHHYKLKISYQHIILLNTSL